MRRIFNNFNEKHTHGTIRIHRAPLSLIVEGDYFPRGQSECSDFPVSLRHRSELISTSPRDAGGLSLRGHAEGKGHGGREKTEKGEGAGDGDKENREREWDVKTKIDKTSCRFNVLTVMDLMGKDSHMVID